MNVPPLLQGLVCISCGLALLLCNGRIPDLTMRLYTYLNGFQFGFTRPPPSPVYLAGLRIVAAFMGAALALVGAALALAAR